jgi:hypothetical protein
MSQFKLTLGVITAYIPNCRMSVVLVQINAIFHTILRTERRDVS